MTVTMSLICPACGVVIAAVNSTSGVPPKPPEVGETAICVDCSQICIFTLVDGQLRFRAPTDDEFVDLIRDPDVAAAIIKVRTFRETYWRNQP